MVAAKAVNNGRFHCFLTRDQDFNETGEIITQFS